MRLTDHIIDPQHLWRGEQGWDRPIAFVQLSQSGRFPEVPVMPPCPLVGLGDPGHPFASHLDCIAETPVRGEGILGQALANPKAAAVLVQLLRLLPDLDVDQALIAESIAYGLLQGSEEHRAWLAARELPAQPRPDGPDGRLSLSRDADRLTITLDDPAHANAIDRAMRDALFEAFQLAALDEGIERVSLRARGRTFCLGAELSEFGTTTDPATAHAIRTSSLPARMAAQCSEKLDVHVQGGCVGAGLEIAAFARRFTASSDAWFQLPELAMGILPGAGGCVSLSRRIGRQRTALMVLSGKRISARQALAWGLVDEIVDQPS